MKNWRDGYIKVAKGGRPVWKCGISLWKPDHFADDTPVPIHKKGRKKKAK